MAANQNDYEQKVTQLEKNKKKFQYQNADLGHPVPYYSYHFIVEIEGTKTVAAAFAGVSGIKMDTQIAKMRTGAEPRGVQGNYVGITEYSNVTFSKGVIGNTDFLTWLDEAMIPGDTSGRQMINARRNITVTAVTQDGQRGIKWTLKDAMPVGYELREMDANRSEILVESIEFAIMGVTRISLAEQKDSTVRAFDKLPEK